MPTSSMDWGHHRRDVDRLLTPTFGWPRCRQRDVVVVVVDRTWSGRRRHRRHDVVVVVVDATRDVVVVVVVDTTWGGRRPRRPRHDVVMVVLTLAFGWPRR